MADVLVIGDDLTGSNATGALYAKVGMSAVTVTSLAAAEQIHDDVDVLVFNSETRHEDGDVAAGRVREVVERAADWGAQVVKRVDTTLRGNLGAETAAALAGLRASTSGRCAALVVPAFPASERVTVGGHQLVAGVPVHRSWAAKDPFTPVPHSRVASRLAHACDLTVAEVGLDDVSGGLDLRLAEAAGAADAVVVDAMTDDDLAAIAEAADRVSASTGQRWLVVDSGPFGVALASRRGVRRPQPHVPEPLVLVVAGSLTERTGVQLGHMVGALGARLIAISPGDDPDAVVDRLVELRAQGGRVIGVRTCGPKTTPSSGEMRSTLDLITEVSRRAVARLRPAGVYATGGDVAMTVLESLGGRGFRITHEVLPLAVMGAISGGPHSGTGFATKGGLVGDDDSATLCVAALQQAARQASSVPLVDVFEKE